MTFSTDYDWLWKTLRTNGMYLMWNKQTKRLLTYFTCKNKCLVGYLWLPESSGLLFFVELFIFRWTKNGIGLITPSYAHFQSLFECLNTFTRLIFLLCLCVAHKNIFSLPIKSIKFFCFNFVFLKEDFFFDLKWI